MKTAVTMYDQHPKLSPNYSASCFTNISYRTSLTARNCHQNNEGLEGERKLYGPVILRGHGKFNQQVLPTVLYPRVQSIWR